MLITERFEKLDELVLTPSPTDPSLSDHTIRGNYKEAIREGIGKLPGLRIDR